MTARVSAPRAARKLQQRPKALDEGADAFVMLGLGGHLVAARHLADGNAVLRPVEFSDQMFQQLFHALARLSERAGDLFGGQRLLGHVDDGFQHGLELRVIGGERGGLRRRISQQLVGGNGFLWFGLNCVFHSGLCVVLLDA